MTRVVAIILHALPGVDAGPLESAFAAARLRNAQRQARGFEAAGALARIVEVQPGKTPFGTRLKRLAALDAGAGIVVLGSGSVPLATAADRRVFVAAAAAAGAVLTNNRYSADILAIPGTVDLSGIPEHAIDNGLPRWFAERGVAVRDLRTRWRLGVDLDSPLDVEVLGLAQRTDPLYERVRDVTQRIRERIDDPSGEFLVAGRTSAGVLGWLEEHTATRTRVLVEERGMRTAAPGQRSPRSTLAMLLDREGPDALGRLVAELSDAAVIDSRVLLAHRLGADEAAWPRAEDRFASDLLLHERIDDPWLRSLTRSAVEAPIPILLGGHSLVGPGLRLLLGSRRR